MQTTICYGSAGYDLVLFLFHIGTLFTSTGNFAAPPGSAPALPPSSVSDMLVAALAAELAAFSGPYP